MVEGELTFLCGGFLGEGIGHSTKGGAWVHWTWAIVLKIHGGLLASVSHFKRWIPRGGDWGLEMLVVVMVVGVEGEGEGEEGRGKRREREERGEGMEGGV